MNINMLPLDAITALAGPIRFGRTPDQIERGVADIVLGSLASRLNNALYPHLYRLYPVTPEDISTDVQAACMRLNIDEGRAFAFRDDGRMEVIR